MSDLILYHRSLARFDERKGSFEQWKKICATNARRAAFRAKLREWKRQAVTCSIDADGGEGLLASSAGGGNREVDKFVDKIDSKLALEKSHGLLWAACVGIRCGFGLGEIADKLGIPRTTLRRALRNFGREVAHGA